eukprot:m.113812 g.113812  ORF g.113812 m.113812 type:complete len:361 (+) comp13525_c0_seq1:360-1442(+)
MRCTGAKESTPVQQWMYCGYAWRRVSVPVVPVLYTPWPAAKSFIYYCSRAFDKMVTTRFFFLATLICAGLLRLCHGTQTRVKMPVGPEVVNLEDDDAVYIGDDFPTRRTVQDAFNVVLNGTKRLSNSLGTSYTLLKFKSTDQIEPGLNETLCLTTCFFKPECKAVYAFHSKKGNAVCRLLSKASKTVKDTSQRGVTWVKRDVLFSTISLTATTTTTTTTHEATTNTATTNVDSPLPQAPRKWMLTAAGESCEKMCATRFHSKCNAVAMLQISSPSQVHTVASLAGGKCNKQQQALAETLVVPGIHNLLKACLYDPSFQHQGAWSTSKQTIMAERVCQAASVNAQALCCCSSSGLCPLSPV